MSAKHALDGLIAERLLRSQKRTVPGFAFGLFAAFRALTTGNGVLPAGALQERGRCRFGGTRL
jgi:hypothetical protein